MFENEIPVSRISPDIDEVSKLFKFHALVAK